VVFTPPTDTDLGFFQDKLTIQGTNAEAGFDVNLYARVTSSQVGAVQFYVDDILGLDVPNATVRLRNTDLQVELPPVTTDINGLVTVSNLQEGDWSWEVSAPGYSGNVGVTTVIPDQTVQTHTRLNKSLVTVSFTVTPVPFSDTYDITIEQTFETHVPIPVLVLTPAVQNFYGVTPGFQASYTLTAQNEGLVEMSDLTISGQQVSGGTLTPLITYVPVLGAQQSIDIPVTVTYSGTNAPSRQGAGGALLSCAEGQIGDGDLLGNFLAGMNAFAAANAHCPKDNTAIALAAAAGAIMNLADQSVNLWGRVAKFAGCLLGHLLGLLGGLPPTPGAYLPTIQLQQSMQQFVPIQQGCFAGDTRVLLADGRFKTIDQIKPGDVVKSGVNRFAVATIADTYERKDNTCREIRFALPGQAEPDEVETTDEHLFWVDGKGWVAAVKLEVGDWLMNDNGQRVQIVSNRHVPGTHEVYTLKLRGDTAFYANDVLVHDLCGDWTTPGRVDVGWTLPAPKPLRVKGSK
ncbi:MAG: polymorphic toxin-type HINT domain-containing protein, partial [Limisphaerales bacterium]